MIIIWLIDMLKNKSRQFLAEALDVIQNGQSPNNEHALMVSLYFLVIIHVISHLHSVFLDKSRLSRYSLIESLQKDIQVQVLT